ncbi:MAG: energy-coupling factor ABC transporter permease [Gemmataceae bacterium]|nr:energy-coupling factor ABC transporter permease [Gemmataceae bacterium]
MLTLWAVHISDGVLAAPWWAGGLGAAAVLATLGAWRVRDEEIPRIALLTAAFFIASSFHVPVGPGSAHLLLNGLIGVLLGLRAGLAIPIGLLLQALLLRHGGYLALGVNSCVMGLPALVAWAVFAGLHRLPWSRRPWFRSLLVALCALAWVLGLVCSVALLVTTPLRQLTPDDAAAAAAFTFQPLVLVPALVLAGLAAWAEQRLANAPEFALGLLVGELAVLLTVVLNCLVLVAGGEAILTTTALLLLVAHLPIAVIEGIVVGFTVGFLAKVKPDLLGLPAAEVHPARAAITTQSNGAGGSHATGLCPDPSSLPAAGAGGGAVPDTGGASAPARR